MSMRNGHGSSPSGATALAAALVLSIAVLAGCTTTNSRSAENGESTVSDRGRAEGVLSGLAATLRPVVDALAEMPTAVDNQVTVDGAGPCSGGSAEWPAKWNYDRSLFLDVRDSRPEAQKMLANLQEQGWTIVQDQSRDTPTESWTNAHKDGATITIQSGTSADEAPGIGLVIYSGTACVQADGTYDQSPPS